jgi:hypothetical protein
MKFHFVYCHAFFLANSTIWMLILYDHARVYVHVSIHTVMAGLLYWRNLLHKLLVKQFSCLDTVPYTNTQSMLKYFLS